MKTVTITFDDAWHILFRTDGSARTPADADKFRKVIGEQAFAEIEAYGREKQLGAWGAIPQGSEKHLNAVKAAVELAGQISIRDLRRAVHGDRFPEDFDWAIKYLESRGMVLSKPGPSKSVTLYWVIGA